MNALTIQGLSVVSDEGTALVTDVSFTLAGAGVLTLVGETGSGKSLLADAVMGTLARGLRASGQVIVGSLATAAHDTTARRSLWGRGLSLLPQEPWASLDPTMPARRQVSEVYEQVRGLDGGVARSRTEADLAALGLADAGRKYPFQLSGGMAQRVAFAAVHAAGGRPVFVADEPTKGLDVRWRDHVVTQLRGVQAEGGAVLAITHDLDVARQLGGSLAVMLDGVVVEQGPTERVLANPSHDYTRRLMAAQPAAWRGRAPERRGPLLLRASGLTKALGNRTLFRDLTLDIHAGSRVAVVGPSGSGKTTLGNVLLGLSRPDAGVLTHASDAGHRGFQKLYQDPVAAFSHHASLRVLLHDAATLHRQPWTTVEHLCQRLQLDLSLLERPADQVSGGELQRVALVRALVANPVLIFADEPTSRLDPITQQLTMDLLVELTEDRGCALVLVTHDRDVAANVCTQIVELGT